VRRIDVLVTDASGNHALAVIRSLGRRGVRVAAAGGTWSSMGLFSRYCAARAVYPDPASGVEPFREGLARILERLRPALLMPMTERTLLALDADREAIESRVRLAPLPPRETLEVAFDKRATVDLATSLGIPVPRTFVPSSLRDLETLRGALTYPVVIKPHRSERVTPDGRVEAGGPVEYCYRPEDLDGTFLAVHARSPRPLVQEFIPGEGYGVSALCRHGTVKALFAHRRLRMLRPTGSGSTLRESIAPPPAMAAAARALLERLRWHGVAMVEFKLDRRDGVPKLMEINGRFWNSLPLAVAAGVDFPHLLHRLAVDGDCPEQFEYRPGVRCRWLAGDARQLLAVLRGRPDGWQDGFPTRRRAILDFVKGSGRGVHYDDLWLGDPLPFVAGIGDAVLRRIPRPRPAAGAPRPGAARSVRGGA
jgi:predicted ATP-grasp superfamily ATP-dependent carboligase